MNEALRDMLARYACRTQDDYVNAMREIMQELALLGLWRGKFFEKAAFYGGTALRILYGLDRYSEDLDFSLLKPDARFHWGPYGTALCREMRSFGFDVEFSSHSRTASAIESAFLKTNSLNMLLTVEPNRDGWRGIHPRQVLKIKLEVDTDPPGGFQTESRYMRRPIPFPVRTYRLPDLFAGKVHAALCRKWKSRVKGRDWYDLAWYAGRHPELNVRHLEARMRQSGHYADKAALTGERILELLEKRIEELDVAQVRREVEPFVKDSRALEVWSREFFRDTVRQIRFA